MRSLSKLAFVLRLPGALALLLAAALPGCLTGTIGDSPLSPEPYPATNSNYTARPSRSTSQAAIDARNEYALAQLSHTGQPAAVFGQPIAVGKPETPLPSQARAGLTLDEAINLCLLADPKLRAGFEAINQANADALTASLKPNPDLAADIQLLPLTRPFTVTEQGGPPQMDIIVGFPIDWFLFGKRASAMVSAAHGVRAAQAEYADLVRRRVTETGLAYFDVLEARDLSDLARQDLETVRRLEVAARKKKGKNGSAEEVALNRLRLEISNTQKAQRDADTNYRTVKAKLRALLGHTERHVDVSGRFAPPARLELMSSEEAYLQATKERPDIEALHWKTAQAHADIEVENRKAYPPIKPSLGYTRQFQTQAIGFPDANSWSFWVEMGLPFLNRNEGNRKKAASRAAQNNFELQTKLNELRAEIENALEEVRAARVNLDAEDQQRLARQIRDAVHQAYLKGDQSLADVLDAERTYRETARAVPSTQAAYWRALCRFNAAVGKQIYR